MDIEVILDAAKGEAPGLRELARRFLEADAGHLRVPLDVASVLAWRAEGVPEVHVTGAADELVRHLAAQPDALSEGGALMALARVGALALVTRAEMNDRYASEPGRPR